MARAILIGTNKRTVARTRTRTRTHTHKYTRARAHAPRTHMHTRTRAYPHTRTHAHAHTHTHKKKKNTNTHTHTNTQTHTHTHARTHARTHSLTHLHILSDSPRVVVPTDVHACCLLVWQTRKHKIDFPAAQLTRHTGSCTSAGSARLKFPRCIHALYRLLPSRL